MIAKKQENITFESVISSSPNIFDAFKSNFIYSISNYNISLVLFSIIVQYYAYSSTTFASVIIIILPEIIVFIGVFFVACVHFYLNECSKIKIFKKIHLDLNTLNFNKIIGLITVIITAQNLSVIIK